MKKILTILRKEWAEVFKNRMVIFTIAFLPLIMTAIPLGILFAVRGDAAAMSTVDAGQLSSQMTAMCPAGLSEGECFQVFMVSQFMIMFLILPLAIPASIASYSIVGEKTTRSLEPLLATPISTAELLIGKSLAAALPGVFATYVAYAIFALGAYLLTSNPLLLGALLDARWLLAIFVVGPLMALMAVNATIMVSSRVNDPRVAEQLSMVVLIPVLGVFFGQMAGLFVINRQLVLVATVIMTALDALLVYLAVRLFQRETILTRWR